MKIKFLPVMILLLFLPTACAGGNRGIVFGKASEPSISLPDVATITPTPKTPIPASGLKRDCNPGPLPDFSKLNKEQISFPKQFCDWKQTTEDWIDSYYTAPKNHQFVRLWGSARWLQVHRTDAEAFLTPSDNDHLAWYEDQIYCLHRYSDNSSTGATITHCLAYLTEGSIFVSVAATDRNGFEVPDEVAGGLAVEFYKAIGQESLK